jgi:hypothetical protein
MESFLSLIRKRFEGKDDSVPWELDDKIEAYNLVEIHNVKHANIIAILNDIGDIKDLDLPDKFVIKISNRHSSIGVMLLEKISDNKFFDHISLNEYDLNKAIATQRIIAERNKKEGTYWVIEELLENFLPNNIIPFDYKFYCFHGQPKLIVQMDRNCTPPRAAIFDGTFMPLINGKDYSLDPDRLIPGNHILPSHPISLLITANKLSKLTNDKFVRIDLYDTPEGVYFGEFTFAPGAPDVGMIKLSYDILSDFDLFLNDKTKIEKISNTQEYFLFNEKKYNETINKVKNNVNNDYHTKYLNKLLIRAYNGDLRALRRLALSFSFEHDKIQDENIKLLNQHLSMSWKMIAYNYGGKDLICNIVKDVVDKKGFVQKKTLKFDNLILECKNYLYLRGINNWWCKIRQAEFLLEITLIVKSENKPWILPIINLLTLLKLFIKSHKKRRT